MAEPVLSPQSPPIDLALPSSATELINMVASYLKIAGLDGFQGVIISDTEPATTDRDKAWIKLDSTSGRAIGLYRYLGGWKLVPVIVGSGDVEPANPKAGELFYNTKGNSLKAFLDSGWTTELWHKDTTANRPANVAIGYIFFDTSISRLLRFTAAGWTTVDGFIGEMRMATGITIDDATTKNPGWVIEYSMGGKFPIGQDTGDYTLGKEAGNDKISWSASTGSAAGGSREQGLVTGISFNGDSAAGAANTSTTKDNSFSIVPPYRAVIFLRKSY